MIWVIIVLLGIVADQISKQAIVRNINYLESIPIISNFFYLTYTENRGAAWSILQNGRIFFIIVASVASIVIIYYLKKNTHLFLRISLSVILGGAIGNLIDRIYKGSVVDFLEFRFGNYTFPIFNIADSLVVVGTILLAIYMLFIYKDNPALKSEE